MKKLLYVLSFLSFFSYFGISIAGLNAKYDQLFIGLIVLVFSVYIIIIRRSIYIDAGGILLLILLLLSLYSSYFNSPDRRYSMIQTVNLFSVSLIYFIIPNVLVSLEDVSRFIAFYLRVSLIWLIAATVLFVFSYSTKTEVFGINLVQNESEPFGVYFTMLEPNIFGSFMLVILCISLTFTLSKVPLAPVKLSEMKMILIWASIGVFISFTRGVWLAVIVVVACYYLINSKNIRKTLVQMFYISAGTLILIYVAGEVLEIGFVKYKLTNFLSADSGTGQGRVIIWLRAIDNWKEQGNIYFGNGTYSYASFFNTDGYGRENAWIGNVFLTFLHDVGIVGLLVFILFYYQLTRAMIKSKRLRYLENYPLVRTLSISLLFSLLGIGIAFFFTPALTFSYPWILFGLISAVNRISTREINLVKAAN